MIKLFDNVLINPFSSVENLDESNNQSKGANLFIYTVF